jgi:hypothetical protein
MQNYNLGIQIVPVEQECPEVVGQLLPQIITPECALAKALMQHPGVLENRSDNPIPAFVQPCINLNCSVATLILNNLHR